MNAKALEQLDNAKGFEVGVGPSVVLVDEGMAKIDRYTFSRLSTDAAAV